MIQKLFYIYRSLEYGGIVYAMGHELGHILDDDGKHIFIYIIMF